MYRRTTLILMLAGGVLSSCFAVVSVPNGHMDDGFITAEGDTMPLRWGSSARRDSGRVRMGFEMVDCEGDGAMRLQGEAGRTGTWLGGFQDERDNAGRDIGFGAWVKLQDVGLLEIGLVRFCGGGGYCELAPDQYKVAFSQSGSTPGWQLFAYTVTIPDQSECNATCPDTIEEPRITISLSFTGPGTALVDCMYVDHTHCNLLESQDVRRSDPVSHSSLPGEYYDLLGRRHRIDGRAVARGVTIIRLPTGGTTMQLHLMKR